MDDDLCAEDGDPSDLLAEAYVELAEGIPGDAAEGELFPDVGEAEVSGAGVEEAEGTGSSLAVAHLGLH